MIRTAKSRSQQGNEDIWDPLTGSAHRWCDTACVPTPTPPSLKAGTSWICLPGWAAGLFLSSLTLPGEVQPTWAAICQPLLYFSYFTLWRLWQKLDASLVITSKVSREGSCNSSTSSCAPWSCCDTFSGDWARLNVWDPPHSCSRFLLIMSFATLCCVISATNHLDIRNLHIFHPGTTSDEH